jgi:hypothetical protein
LADYAKPDAAAAKSFLGNGSLGASKATEPGAATGRLREFASSESSQRRLAEDHAQCLRPLYLAWPTFVLPNVARSSDWSVAVSVSRQSDGDWPQPLRTCR